MYKIPEEMTLSALESYIDEASDVFRTSFRDVDSLGALESYIDETLAMEGLFGPRPVDKLLKSVTKTINKKCKTVADCDEMMIKIGNEAEKFNHAIGSMIELVKQFQNEQISKKEMAAGIKSLSKELKASCDMLNLSDVVKNSSNITEEEMANLKAFIEGTKEIITRRKAELSEGKGSGAIESFIAELENMTIAEEGAMTYALKIRFSEGKKKAIGLMKQAKAKVKAGDLKGAIDDYKKAKDGFKKLISEANKIQDYDDPSLKYVKDGNKNVSVKQYPFSKAALISYCETKIQRCDELIFKVKNKMEKAAGATEASSLLEELEFEMALEGLLDPALESSSEDDDDDEDEDDIDDLLED